jgi:hypothetical protein
MYDNGQGDRVPLLAADFDRWVDNVAEHFTWHGFLLALALGQETLGELHRLGQMRQPKAAIIVSGKTESQ